MKRLLLLIALSFPLAAPTAAAQGLSLIPYAGFNLESGYGPLVGIGAQFDAPFGAGGLVLAIQPGVEYVFMDSDFLNYLQLDGNVIAAFGAPGASIMPYAGAGIAIAFISTDDIDTGFGTIDGASNTEIGLNVLGGVEFPGVLAFGDPFAQARLTLVDGGNLITIIGGFKIPLGG